MNPFFSFCRSTGYFLSNRIHFPRNRIGEVVTADDGKQFIIFRQVFIDHKKNQVDKPGVTFIVRFRITHMSARQNKLFSLLPIPFFTGLPGFRAKLWMHNEKTGEFQGIYQWETAEAAECYAKSFAMKFMTMRSVPGSISYRIVPEQDNSIEVG
jgi:hypothetical protein